MKKHVIVIGGGLAGTAAAQSLITTGYAVTIIETNDYIGGRIHSKLVDNTAVEMGAGFMTNAYTNLHHFLGHHGLSSKLYRRRSGSGIYRDGKVLMSSVSTFAGTDALSWGAKSQALPLLVKVLASWQQLDLHAFWQADRYDTLSIADMYADRHGKEFLEYVLQPILSGYFYWTPEHTSKAMLLILGKAAWPHITYKMHGGLQQIPEKAAEGSEILLSHSAKQVRRNKDKSYKVIVEHRGRRQILKADGIVCAATATAVSGMFPELSKQQRMFFDAIQYSSGALIAKTYTQKQTRGDHAIAFPRQEGIELSAITLSPEPREDAITLATLKTYASGKVAGKLCTKSDQVIIQTLTHAMEPVRQAVLVGNPKPLAVTVQRWPEALPCFDVGQFKRLHAFINGGVEDQNQPVVFAGDYLGGPFMEGAFTSGIEAAARLVARLSA